jgi:3-oxoacyl-[acyl-carrier protein] reductase
MRGEVILQEQVALVTGASRGIGKEIALELARNGCRVAINYYNDPPALVDAAVSEISSLGVEVLPIEADIRSTTLVAGMVDRIG